MNFNHVAEYVKQTIINFEKCHLHNCEPLPTQCVVDYKWVAHNRASLHREKDDSQSEISTTYIISEEASFKKKLKCDTALALEK